ncbi:MAG: hypothetical protein LUE16_05355 [Lachnospiraceae bacterium]|nr:hypothetical protein [Lachnospiraceae bacterium]
MKKMGGVLKALVWLLFTVPVAFGSTIYYFETVSSYAAVDVVALLLWGCVILLLFLLGAFLCRWAEKRPGFFRLGEGAALVLELICCVILVAGGIYLRIGREFVAFWSSQDGNPVVEAALVTASGLSLNQADFLSNAYVYLLNQLFMLVGNLSMAAAGMQLALFSVTCFLLYFLVRRTWGALCAVICLGALMLFPEMIRLSMYCSPETLLLLGVVALGWLLHLCFDRFLKRGFEAAPDFLLLICLLAGCIYYQQTPGISGVLLSERISAVGGQTALLAGLLSLIFFLFLRKEKRAASVYMVMAVIVLAAQLMGMQEDMGCQAALCVVMTLLLGVLLRDLLGGEENGEEEEYAEIQWTGTEDLSLPEDEPLEEAEAEEKELPAEEESIPEEKLQTLREEGMPEEKPQPVKEEGMSEEKLQPVIEESMPEKEAASARPEIFIPKSMEIPKRKKRAKIDYDKDFSETEMKFDIEIPDEEEFDR